MAARSPPASTSETQTSFEPSRASASASAAMRSSAAYIAWIPATNPPWPSSVGDAPQPLEPDQLYTALETILNRAPSAVIEDMARSLTSRAGKYGDER